MFALWELRVGLSVFFYRLLCYLWAIISIMMVITILDRIPIVGHQLLYILTALFVYALINKVREFRKLNRGVIHNMNYTLAEYAILFSDELTSYYSSVLMEAYQELQQQANVCVPVKLYIFNDQGINALNIAGGIIAISNTALNSSADDEIKGMLSHELGHIIHKDWLYFLPLGVFEQFRVYLMIPLFIAVAFTYSLPIALLFVLAWYLTMPLLGQALSRAHEQSADLFSVRLGYAQALISILENTIDSYHITEKDDRTSIFSSHPGMRDRIRDLKNMDA